MSTVNIMGIDPSTTNTGVSILTLNRDLQVDKVTTKTIVATGGLNHRIFHMGVSIEKLLLKYKPIGVSIETPFIYSKRPSSVVPLARVFGVINYSIMRVNDKVRIIQVAPSQWKKDIGVKANKSDKQEVINKMESLFCLCNINEHEADSLGVATFLLNRIKEFPFFVEELIWKTDDIIKVDTISMQ